MASVMTAKEIYITGLKNAHAMENQALSIMKPQVNRIEHYPDVASALQRHITETEAQIQRIEQLLSQSGASHSSLKDMALSASGAMAALGHTIAGDEILKNSFANFAFENFEIAAYTSLITVGEESGEADLSLLRQSLDEERRMAAWIEENLPAVTRAFIALSTSGERADI